MKQLAQASRFVVMLAVLAVAGGATAADAQSPEYFVVVVGDGIPPSNLVLTHVIHMPKAPAPWRGSSMTYLQRHVHDYIKEKYGWTAGTVHVEFGHTREEAEAKRNQNIEGNNRKLSPARIISDDSYRVPASQ